jgi:hypothetical protein
VKKSVSSTQELDRGTNMVANRHFRSLIVLMILHAFPVPSVSDLSEKTQALEVMKVDEGR